MKLLGSVLVAAMFAGSAFAQALPVAQSLVNRRAPSFSLPDSNFKQYDILDYRGKWLLLTFLSSSANDCPQCREIIRRVDAVVARNPGKAAALGIAQTPADNQTTLKALIAETKTKMPIVFDNSFVAIAYFRATPDRSQIDLGHLFAINPEGTIVKDWVANAVAVAPNFERDITALITGAKPTAAPAAEEKAKPAKARK
jgi:peroxiredoxin